MLQKNVKVGGEYLCKIGGELRRVRVDQLIEKWDFYTKRNVTRFRVTELRSGKTLPKLRSSGSLREIPEPTTNTIHCKWCRRAFQILGENPLPDTRVRRDAHELICEKNPSRDEDVAYVDVRVQKDVDGPATVYAFTLVTERAREWVDANVAEPHILGAADASTLIVEHRYAPLLVEGLRAAGLVVA